MSVGLMAAVFDLGIESGDKLVLLALADNANDDGYCWPSQATIARKCSMSERRVRDRLHALANQGWIRVLALGNGRGKSTEYLLAVGLIKADAASQKADARKADVSDTKGGKGGRSDEKADVSNTERRTLPRDQPSLEPSDLEPSDLITARAPATPPKKSRKRDLDDAGKDELVAKHLYAGPESEIREQIALALSHNSAKNYPDNLFGYVNNWLRRWANEPRRPNAIAQGPAGKERWAGAERGAPSPYSLDELRKRPNFIEIGDEDDGDRAEG